MQLKKGKTLELSLDHTENREGLGEEDGVKKNRGRRRIWRTRIVNLLVSDRGWFVGLGRVVVVGLSI